MRVNFLSFTILASISFVAATGNPHPGNYPTPSQVPTPPSGGYECPPKDASGHASSGKQDLGNGTFKCFYDWSGEGGQPQDNHCTYDVKGNCGADHNYNKCKSQAAPRHRSRAPSPPTAGHAAPRALKQLKIKRDQKSRMVDL